MNNNTVLFTVAYPAVGPFISEFLQSLAKQTDKNFTLFLLNDGLSDIDRYLEGVDISFEVLEHEDRPTALRKTGIKWALSEGAEFIIFGDTDDYFAVNRIEISKKMMSAHDVVCNEIYLTGEEYPQPVPMLGELLNDETEINIKDIERGNCLGLSNTSIKADKISKLMSEIPDDVVAFDWAFFALSLHEGAKTIFTNKTQTYYRQHGNNIASPCSFSEKQILRAVRVKRDHYCFLSKYYDGYVDLSKQFERLNSRLQSDLIFKSNYCEAVRREPGGRSKWWEPIKALEESQL